MNLGIKLINCLQIKQKHYDSSLQKNCFINKESARLVNSWISPWFLIIKLSEWSCRKSSQKRRLRNLTWGAILRHFCDTSLSAYCSVLYLISLNSDAKVHCALLVAKFGVALIQYDQLKSEQSKVVHFCDFTLPTRDLALNVHDSVV